MEALDDIASKSKITEKDTLELGDALKRDLAARYKIAMRRRHGS